MATQTLHAQISDKAKEIRTDGYAMSIGEVMSLYRDGDVDIHPEFQRIFRWTEAQKSRLIESILLGIPIPPVFVSQRSNGVWDVIDGVQRLSTVLEFVGAYIDEEGKRRPPFELEAGEYLTELAGVRFTAAEPGSVAFDDILRRDFKRAKLEFRIITKESDENAKYDLFQRLNAGSTLSPQEIRNCLLVMLNREMFRELGEYRETDAFAATVPLSERQRTQAYADELVLRFFCIAEFEGPSQDLSEEFGEYLTHWMRRVAVSGTALDRSAFTRTFALLERALGDEVFKRFDGSRHLGAFSISGYEAICGGVAAHLDHWESESPQALRERIEAVWLEDEFASNSGSGISTRRRMPRLVNFGRKFFDSQ